MTSSERSREESDTIDLPVVETAIDTDAASGPHDNPDAAWPTRMWHRGSRRRRDLLAAGGIAGILAVLGFPLGALWNILAPRVEMVRVDGGWGFAEENPEQYMGDDGVFALLGIGCGIAVAVAVWIALRSRRGPLMLTGLVLGSILCQTIAWRFGRFGRDDYLNSLDSVQVGWHTWRAPDLLMVDFHPFGSGEPGKIDTAWEALSHGDLAGMWDHLTLGVLATMGFTVAFTYTVCAGWSKYASLRAERDPRDGHA
ncbi:MAG: hypothetical protein ACRD0P_02590 [Stackebrandtia sp.]